MLDFNMTEMLVVAVVALLVIGPKDLPKAMRFVGQWVAKARGVARQFRTGFDSMVREAELAEMEKKWSEENARIMREHPPALTSPDRKNAGYAAQDEAVPHDEAVARPPADARPADDVCGHDDGERPPVSVEKPVVRADPDPHAAPAADNKASS